VSINLHAFQSAAGAHGLAQHSKRLEAADVQAIIAAKGRRIAALEADEGGDGAMAERAGPPRGA
jgi:DUF1009 family protein